MKKILQLSFVLLLVFGGVSFAQGVHNTVVNINTADQATLASIPGIGKHRAKLIVNYRTAHGPFKDIEHLTEVKGITEKNLQNILKHNTGQIIAK